MGLSFNQTVDYLLNLDTLKFCSFFKVDLLPQTLIKLCIGGDHFNQPIPSLSHLNCQQSCPKTTLDIISKSSLSSLKVNFNEPIDCLPNSLKRLNLGNEFNSEIKNLS
jgi:FNIP Repeat